MMEQRVRLSGKDVRVTLSPAAQSHLSTSEPVCAELELYFSCLIRKRVRFTSGCADPSAVAVQPGLCVRFHPVMSQRCEVAETDGAPPLTDFPIKRPEAYVPKWLRVDYREGAWHGEFGFT